MMSALLAAATFATAVAFPPTDAASAATTTAPPACSLGNANRTIVAEAGGTCQKPFAFPDATAMYCLPPVA